MSEEFELLCLDDRLLRAIGKQNLEKPTEVQEAVIPHAVSGADILAHAPTSSGKTLAYLLPMLQRLLEMHGQKGGPHALVLVPTRELVRQVFKEAVKYAEFTNLRLATVSGGESYQLQEERLQHPPELLIATPGRLLGWLQHGDLSLFDVHCCVLDEADRMLDMGMGPEIEELISLMDENRQLMLFSATLDESRVDEFAEANLQEPETVSIGLARSLPSHIQQIAYFADDLEHKTALLIDILQHSDNRSMVFSYSRERCEQIAAKLQSVGIRSQTLHGEIAQKVRHQVVYRFSSGSHPVLVSTDLAARGLHIEGVERVIHFDLPRNTEVYIHRSGRAGRNAESGESLLLVEAHDARLLGRIERYQQQVIIRRSRKGLEPKHKEPDLSRKKKKDKLTQKPKKPTKKPRWRDLKNKGKPKGPLGKGKQNKSSENQ